MFNYIVLFSTVIFSVLSNILLKKGSLSLGETPMSLHGVLEFALMMFKNIYVMGGLAIYGIAFFLWVWLLSKMQLNIAYPISMSSQLLLISIASWFLFRESMSGIQIGGVAAIIFGILLLTRVH